MEAVKKVAASVAIVNDKAEAGFPMAVHVLGIARSDFSILAGFGAFLVKPQGR